MEKALRIIEEMQRAGVIKRYAIGGGIAALYYAEPVLTYDLDVFFLPIRQSLDILSPVYDFLKQRGHRPLREHVQIHGVPVQFIPAYNDLVEEAVREAVRCKHGAVETRVLRPEHLIAVGIQTGRPKDRERVVLLVAQSTFSRRLLKAILRRHGLYEKFLALKLESCSE